MGFKAYLITYILGGLTFLPLLLAAVLTSAWYLSPQVKDADSNESGREKKDLEAEKQAQRLLEERSRASSIGDAGASGTFAVLRSYDFQAAISALNAKNNTGGNAGTNADGSLVGDGGSGMASESVYQSMYRSVFAGSRNATKSLLGSEDPHSATGSRRRPVPANVLYIILRHGHLMVYDSPAQVEVKHVISLAHHRVSLQAGREGEDEAAQDAILEPDLFTKRTAIVLTPVELPNGALQPSATHKPSMPFFLFCMTNIDKEDFYHALLATRLKPPIPRPLDGDALIKLQSLLHSSSLTPETRALNAIVGRVFLSLHQTDTLTNFIRGKIEKKLKKIQKPSFIPVLEIRSLDVGDASPIFSNLKLRELNISGDTTISADVRYNGGLSVTLLAVAKLDLGPRFKTRTVDLVLKTSMRRVQGTMLIHIKPPPTNRIWFCFESIPDLDVRVEPVVSERKITYGFVLRAIEERIRTAFGEGLVKPNWDDVPMPLQNTRTSHARGGVWIDAGDEHPSVHRSESARVLAERNEKTMSVPSFAPELDKAATTGLVSSSDINLSRLRYSSTMPIGPAKRRSGASNDDAVGPEIRPPKPLRSPSMSSPSPSVAMDQQNAESVRADDESLRPAQRRHWMSRGAQGLSQTPPKDALEELRQLRARAEEAVARPPSVATRESDSLRYGSDSVHGQDATDTNESGSIRSRQHSDGSDPTPTVTPRSVSIRSTDSDSVNSMTSGLSRSLPRSQHLHQKKTTILAAAGAATNAARTWGWNTIQKNKGAFQKPAGRSEHAGQIPAEPMGRGQPLPPPGVPLPGPQKALWGSVGGGHRKPVPPVLPQRPKHQSIEGKSGNEASGQDGEVRDETEELEHADDFEDDFGTWQENPGADDEADFAHEPTVHHGSETVQDAPQHPATDAHMSARVSADDEDLLDLSADEPRVTADSHNEAAQTSAKNLPPPLPARRPGASDIVSLGESHAIDAGSSHSVIESERHGGEGLRVPEAEASAIAAENSTYERARGEADDLEHVDGAEGVEIVTELGGNV